MRALFTSTAGLDHVLTPTRSPEPSTGSPQCVEAFRPTKTWVTAPAGLPCLN